MLDVNDYDKNDRANQKSGCIFDDGNLVLIIILCSLLFLRRQSANQNNENYQSETKHVVKIALNRTQRDLTDEIRPS